MCIDSNVIEKENVNVYRPGCIESRPVFVIFGLVGGTSQSNLYLLADIKEFFGLEAFGTGECYDLIEKFLIRFETHRRSLYDG